MSIHIYIYIYIHIHVRANVALLFLGRVTFNSTGLLPSEQRLMCDPFLRCIPLFGGGGNHHFWLVDSNFLKTNKNKAATELVGIKISSRVANQSKNDTTNKMLFQGI